MPHYERRIISGDYMEIDRYYATGHGKNPFRGAKTDPSSEQQQKLNDINAWKRLWRLIVTNFSGELGDLFATLTHAQPLDEADALRAFENYIARLRRWAHKHGYELKYIVIHEKQGQWHHHLILSGVPMEIASTKWGRGRVMLSTLDRTQNYKDLAKYLTQADKPAKDGADGESIKEPRRKGKRRWSSSRNLQKPVVDVREVKPLRLGAQPKPPKGYRLLPDWNVGCDFRGNLYQSFLCVKIIQPRERKRARSANTGGRGRRGHDGERADE